MEKMSLILEDSHCFIDTMPGSDYVSWVVVL